MTLFITLCFVHASSFFINMFEKDGRNMVSVGFSVPILQFLP